MGNNKTRVYIKRSSWIGIGVGASHYYGELVEVLPNRERNTVKLFDVITQSQATKLNQKIRYVFKDNPDLADVYHKGDEHDGFNSIDDLINKAKEVWKDRFPNAVVLLDGDPSNLEPKIIIDTTLDEQDNAVVHQKSKELYDKCEAISWWDYKKNDDLMEAYTDEFDNLLKEYDL